MNKNKSAAWSVFTIIFVWLFIVLVWFASYCISNNAYRFQRGSLGDLGTVLFGAASLALFMLSIFIAVLAIFGWQTLQENLRKSVENEVGERIESLESKLQTKIEALDLDLRSRIDLLENELRGRVFSILGLVIGETSIDPETFEPKNRDRLRDAVVNSQKGYEILQKVHGPAEYLALNNLVFYSCLVGDKSKASLILGKARLLRDVGQERDNKNLLLTYIRAIIEFGADQIEIAEARTIAQAILENPRSSEQERREAKQYLTSLSVPSEKSEVELTDPTSPQEH